MRINCLSCGHKVDLDDAYEDYNGLIRCCVCNALLEMTAEEGRIRSVRVFTPHGPSVEEAEERMG